jgi:FO synthase subunit 2
VYGANLAGVSVEEYLKTFKEAGLDSLPGTAAEILDDEIRARISPGRINVETWVKVITTAHKLGIPTTSTIMYGHVENEYHIARHLLLLKKIQRETHGFTEFIPLSFVHREAPMWKYNLVPGVKPGPTWREVIALHATARLVFGDEIPNIQASWVKEGTRMAQQLLEAGCNDLGGTLMNESISTTAGATSGQLMKPRELRNIIRSINRIPAQRTTLYKIIKIYHKEEEETELDKIENPEEQFGSYWQLIKDPRFKRYIKQKHT